jgi:NTP pyrophosphatase (non-canonical NTP hydrolase)
MHTDEREGVFESIIEELARQNELKASGKFSHTAENLMFNPTTLRVMQMVSVLTEEVGEVARAANDDAFDELDKELIQVAAVAVSALIGFRAFKAI